MTESGTDQRRIDATAAGRATKYRAFSDGLTPDEHAALVCVVHGIGAPASGAADDVAGYKDTCIDQMLAFDAIVKAASLGFLRVEGGKCDAGNNFTSPEVVPR